MVNHLADPRSQLQSQCESVFQKCSLFLIFVTHDTGLLLAGIFKFACFSFSVIHEESLVKVAKTGQSLMLSTGADQINYIGTELTSDRKYTFG